MEANDILQPIPDTDLMQLRDLYKNCIDEAPHIASMFDTSMKWKKIDKNLVTFYGIRGDYLISGTFVAHVQCSCNDFFVCTLEENCNTLKKVLRETTLINWRRKILFYAVLKKHVQTVFSVLREKNVKYQYGITTLFTIDKEDATNFQITLPDDVYEAKLTEEHANEIDNHWPHRYPGSEGYVSALIKMNGGFGIFSKKDHTLLAWIIRSFLGQIAILQTIEEHKRKGYAAIAIKLLAKEIAAEGYDAGGTVVKGNKPSESLFTKLGFKRTNDCTYVEIREST